MQPSKRKNTTCPTCGGGGKNFRNPGAPCPSCGGAGVLDSQIPYPYWYPINLTVIQPGTQVGTVPTLVIPGSTPDVNQQGTNPARYKLGSDAPFEWMFNLLKVTSPTVIGDASQYLALLLTDTSTQGQVFQPAPVMANLFAGNAQFPWPILQMLTFGPQTELTLTGYPVNYQGMGFQLGVGNGATTTFTGTIYGPVLQGSLVVTDAPGVIVGVDNGNGIISGTGITGSISSYAGPGVALTISVTYSVAPAANDVIFVTWTQGCALVNAQFALQGSYLKDIQAGQVSAVNVRS